jgi:hypothetical protein
MGGIEKKQLQKNMEVVAVLKKDLVTLQTE